MTEMLPIVDLAEAYGIDRKPRRLAHCYCNRCYPQAEGGNLALCGHTLRPNFSRPSNPDKCVVCVDLLREPSFSNGFHFHDPEGR